MARDTSDRQGRGWSEWNREPRARITPGGPGSTDALGWATRVSLVALVLAIGWLVFASVRPLASGVEAEPLSARAAEPVVVPSLTMTQRSALLDSVTRSNWFSRDRQMWSVQDLAKARGEDTEGEDKGQEVAAQEPAQPVEPDETRPGKINVTKVEDLPEDLAKAYENLELRGIRSRAGGDLLAMIGFVQSKMRPATTAYGVGDTFEDEKFAAEEWRVVLIDGVLDRVVLRRRGQNVMLPLFRGSARLAGESESEFEGNDPGIVGMSRDEVIAQLREAGISEEEIAELMRLAEAEADSADAVADTTQAIDEATSALAEDAGGLQGVLEMMKGAERSVRPVDEMLDPKEKTNTYASTGRGHTVSSVDVESGSVTLLDGSRWSVGTSGAQTIEDWGASPTVSVYSGKRVGRTYVIVNERTKEIVGASHVVAEVSEEEE